MEIPKGFYVYAYLREKESEQGLAGSPYYIGKGIGKRAWVRFRKEVCPPQDKELVEIVVPDRRR